MSLSGFYVVELVLIPQSQILVWLLTTDMIIWHELLAIDECFNLDLNRNHQGSAGKNRRLFFSFRKVDDCKFCFYCTLLIIPEGCALSGIRKYTGHDTLIVGCHSVKL